MIDKIIEDRRLGMEEPDGFVESNQFILVLAPSNFGS